MAVAHARFARHALTPAEAAEAATVDGIAATMERFLEQESLQIDTAHVHGAQSKAIQDIIGDLLLGAGFATEVVITPEDGLVTRARPDFFLRLSSGRGIFAEVERGGAVTNNHDLERRVEGAHRPRRAAPVPHRPQQQLQRRRCVA